MIQIVKKLLLQLLNDIDAGNSNLTEEESIKLLQYMIETADATKKFNRTQAAEYLHCSVQSFDLYRKEGKIPKGTKIRGSGLVWSKSQLDKFIEKYRDKN